MRKPDFTGWPKTTEVESWDGRQMAIPVDDGFILKPIEPDDEAITEELILPKEIYE